MEDDDRNIENSGEKTGDQLHDMVVEGEKNAKNTWTDVKNTAEKAKNDTEAEIENM